MKNGEGCSPTPLRELLDECRNFKLEHRAHTKAYTGFDRLEYLLTALLKMSNANSDQVAYFKGVMAGWPGMKREEDRKMMESILTVLKDSFAQSESSYILPPADANGKRPRLFYWEEAEDCWCPAETLKVEDIIGVDLFMGDGQTEEVRFKRMDMTDAEFAAIPEG